MTTLLAQATLRPGDVVEVRLGGVSAEYTADFTGGYSLDDQGNLNLPYIRQIKVSGLSTSQAQAAIEDKLRAEKIYKNPTITITVAQGQRFVNVGGQVKSPGRLIYSPDLTLMTAINAVGGRADFAGDGIRLIRGGKSFSYSYKRLLKDPGTDPKILPGDQITVLESRSIFGF